MSTEGEYRPDPRLVATRTREGDWLLNVSPVAMSDGRELRWYPPQPVAFALMEAKRYQDRGVEERQAIMSALARRADAAWAPGDPTQTLNCISDLHIAVLYAFTAIESLANHSIDQLDDDATVEVENRKGELVELSKSDMVRRLGISEKLTRVVPMLDDGVNIKGTRPWERYRHLKELRDELVHVKERGYSPDPQVLTAYDRLLLGEGDDCVGDAVAVVVGARPAFLPDFVLEPLAP
ncbi:MAG: hypothetical protein WAN22_10760 [Solirubrobacteraceae bacterium]